MMRSFFVVDGSFSSLLHHAARKKESLVAIYLAINTPIRGSLSTVQRQGIGKLETIYLESCLLSGGKRSLV